MIYSNVYTETGTMKISMDPIESILISESNLVPLLEGITFKDILYKIIRGIRKAITVAIDFIIKVYRKIKSYLVMHDSSTAKKLAEARKVVIDRNIKVIIKNFVNITDPINRDGNKYIFMRNKPGYIFTHLKMDFESIKTDSLNDTNASDLYKFTKDDDDEKLLRNYCSFVPYSKMFGDIDLKHFDGIKLTNPKEFVYDLMYLNGEYYKEKIYAGNDIPDLTAWYKNVNDRMDYIYKEYNESLKACKKNLDDIERIADEFDQLDSCSYTDFIKELSNAQILMNNNINYILTALPIYANSAIRFKEVVYETLKKSYLYALNSPDSIDQATDSDGNIYVEFMTDMNVSSDIEDFRDRVVNKFGIFENVMFI